jgi:hypothetical protein
VTAPPTIPLSPTDRAALPGVVAAAWREVAPGLGVNVERFGVTALEHGGLYWHSLLPAPRPQVPSVEALGADRALRHLALALRERGYAVEGEPMRVTGWAAARPLCYSCHHVATCYGSYEDESPVYACDTCCGHGNEDGWCGPFVEPCACPPPAIGPGPASCHRCGRLRRHVFPAPVRLISLATPSTPPWALPPALASYLDAIAADREALRELDRPRAGEPGTLDRGRMALAAGLEREKAGR